MSIKEVVINAITNQKLVPLFYHNDKDTSLSVVNALYDSGIRLIEWTHRGDNALENFIYLKDKTKLEMPDLCLGVGTIKTKTQAEEYINAGADFIISPAIIEEVGEFTLARNLLWIPGCMTPTEIARAEGMGAMIVKIFPADILGPSFVRAVRELFPKVMFMATGGIARDGDKLRQWFDAGVTAVGIGSALIGKEIVQQKSFHTLTNDTKAAIACIS